MSKYDELTAKLEALETRLNDLSDERAAVMKEIHSIKEMVDIVNEVLKEREESQENALATLYTKSESGQYLNDADFREFGDIAGIDTAGFIESQTEKEAAQENRDAA